MATFSGADGKANLGANENLNVRSWEMTVTATPATGAHSSVTAKWTDAKVKGATPNKSWSGSFEFFQDATTLQPMQAADAIVMPGDTIVVLLTDGSANTYTGSVVVSEVSYANDIEGGELVSGTCSFVGAGALTITKV